MNKKITVKLDASEAQNLSNAASEIQYLTNSVAEVFKLLQVGISIGHLSGPDAEPGLIALSQLCSRAMEQACENEGLTLALFSDLLDDKLKEKCNAA